MKKFHYSFLLLLLSLTARSQQAITITAADMPVPASVFNGYTYSGTATNPAMGTNASWDVSALTTTGTWQNDYPAETDPYWTNKGVNVYWYFSKHLTANATYDTYLEWDFNANGVDEIGYDIPGQAYEISAYTGSTADSIVFPAQTVIANTPRRLMQFPMTAGTAWKSVSRREVAFELSVAALSLKKAPGKHIITYYRSDSVVGWGKMKTYTSKGPSKQYDVLMVKTSNYTLDSFYLNGAPAPGVLLTAFGVTQGQKMEVNNAYNYYRKGFFNYLVRYWYDNRDFTTTTAVYMHSDEVWTNGVAPDETPYTTMVFPNPVHDDIVNVQFMGRNFTHLQYSITDITGRVVATGTSDVSNSILSVPTAGLSNGNYFLHVINDRQETIANEKIQVNR